MAEPVAGAANTLSHEQISHIINQCEAEQVLRFSDSASHAALQEAFASIAGNGVCRDAIKDFLVQKQRVTRAAFEAIRKDLFATYNRIRTEHTEQKAEENVTTVRQFRDAVEQLLPRIERLKRYGGQPNGGLNLAWCALQHLTNLVHAIERDEVSAPAGVGEHDAELFGKIDALILEVCMAQELTKPGSLAGRAAQLENVVAEMGSAYGHVAYRYKDTMFYLLGAEAWYAKQKG